jgi:pyruvate kinase
MSNLLDNLSESLETIISEMTAYQQEHQSDLERVHPDYRTCARNLLDYVAFRSQDHSELQEKLSRVGLSSLGRSEAAIRSQLFRVKALVDGLNGRGSNLAEMLLESPVFEGQRNLENNSVKLLGTTTDQRLTRIMVTMPSEAAENPALVEAFLAAGMNVARINCAHDDVAVWTAIARHIRETSKRLNIPCRIMMDLAGPKLRVGPMPEGVQITKARPLKDVRGRMVHAGKVLFYSDTNRPPQIADAVTIPIACMTLKNLPPLTEILVTDTREKRRRLSILSQEPEAILASVPYTVYFESGQTVTFRSRNTVADLHIGRLIPMESYLTLQTGTKLKLVSDDRIASPARIGPDGVLLEPATISCGVPEALTAPEIGHKIKLDDGKFSGVVIEKDTGSLLLEITETPVGGGKLRAEKGINFPDTDLPVSGLTEKDIEDLDAICRIADCVALSFVNTPADVESLQAELTKRGCSHLGIILKIETRRGYENLPFLLLTAMHSESVGVMIARGDLGVEVGWRQMAELQEEILWLCAAAHIPSIWATQVLETMAKTGQPTRSEITDAAMAQRAECVMLNKGPFMHKTIRMLNRILKTMDNRQYKKSVRLPAIFSDSRSIAAKKMPD